MKRHNLFLATIAAALAVAVSTVSAQTPPWPTKPVRILVGFPGGSTPDMAARVLVEPLSRALGQPVIVDNKVGASGNIAADQIAKANDDHTLGIVINGNLTTAKLLNPKLPYDPAKDFSFISLVGTAPLVLIAPPGLPDGAAFLVAARANGDKWSYGSVGNGSMAHLGMELLKSKAGLNTVHVPYSGNPAVITAMLGGGQIQMALVPPGVAMPQIKAGKIKAIGVTSAKSALVPEVPPLAGAGVGDFNLEVWTALVGPASLSKAAQARLTAELARILGDAEVKQKLFNQGWVAAGTSSEGLKSRVKEDAAVMEAIITSRGIKGE